MTEARVNEINRRLSETFSPSKILVKDQSHLHAGHAGAQDGRGHFAVLLVSDAFEGRSRLERHRMVYDALGTMMQSDIHALTIKAYTNAERG